MINKNANRSNKWFFTDGAFTPETQLQISPNTWQHENFVVVANRQILAYFEAYWSKPLDIITSFRMIFFEKDKSVCIARALFEYFEYLFVIRGCNALNWIVDEKNYHAYRIYEKFIKKYFGHRVGKRQYGQMAYNGDVSDVVLYEVTQAEYLEWKNKKNCSSNNKVKFADF